MTIEDEPGEWEPLYGMTRRLRVTALQKSREAANLPQARLATIFARFADDFELALNEATREANARGMSDSMAAYLMERVQLFNDVVGDASVRIPSIVSSLLTERLQELTGEGIEVALVAGGTETYAILRDLSAWLTDGIVVKSVPKTQEPEVRLVVIKTPSIDVRDPRLWPVVLGHELGHVFIEGHPDFASGLRDLVKKATSDSANKASPERAPGSQWNAVPASFDATQSWLTEIACDLFTVACFGAAGIAAIDTFLRLRSRTTCGQLPPICEPSPRDHAAVPGRPAAPLRGRDPRNSLCGKHSTRPRHRTRCPIRSTFCGCDRSPRRSDQSHAEAEPVPSP